MRADRGGDVTYHGPGQLVGYPILTLPGKRGGDGMADTVAYVLGVEQLLIDVLADLGLDAGRLRGFPGVWVDAGSPTRPARSRRSACGCRRGRSMHGFALNVDPDLAMFDHIVPCGIADKAVTSLAAEGIDVAMREVVDVVSRVAGERWGTAGVERQDVVWRTRPQDLSPFSRGDGSGRAGAARRPAAPQAGVTDGLDIAARKPDVDARAG